MCDDDIHQGQTYDPTVSRRGFGLFTAAAVAAGAGAAHAQAAVVERDVEIRTPNGTADAAVFYPEGRGTHPGVLLWPDIVGLRPVMREMGKRLAAEGYVVLVPNPFYRSKKAPVVGADFNFGDPAQRNLVFGYRTAIGEGGVERDSKAFIDYLDRMPQTSNAKVGVQGYCMGGTFSFQTAAAMPNRVGAVGSFHGGGLATKEANSPHLKVGTTKARYLVAIAQNDDKTDPEAKNTLRKAFADAGLPAVVDVYRGDHGWCVPGSAVYNQAEAERAWAELLRVYKTSLV